MNRNYNYGWQAVFATPWPTDNDSRYDKTMADKAEYMFRRWRHIVSPDLPEPKRHSEEEIAHVEACCKLARLYMDHGDVRRRAAFRGLKVPPPLRLIRTENLTGAEIEAEIAILVAEMEAASAYPVTGRVDAIA